MIVRAVEHPVFLDFQVVLEVQHEVVLKDAREEGWQWGKGISAPPPQVPRGPGKWPTHAFNAARISSQKAFGRR